MNNLHVEKFLHVRLEKINNYLNAIVSKYDSMKTNEDYWATRLEFLLNGGGDCEDYAIAKYQTLLDFGFPHANMGLCVVMDKYSGAMHMVLGVKEGQDLYFLDNLSFRILPYNKRSDLDFYGCLSKDASFSLNVPHRWNSKPPKALENKFKKLLDKVAKEKLWLN